MAHIYQITNIINGKIYIGKTESSIEKRYSKDGNLLATFSTINDASKAIGKSRAHISECANGKRKSAYGFIWKFVE